MDGSCEPRGAHLHAMDGSREPRGTNLHAMDGSRTPCGTYLHAMDGSRTPCGTYLHAMDGSRMLCGTYLHAMDGSRSPCRAHQIRFDTSLMAFGIFRFLRFDEFLIPHHQIRYDFQLTHVWRIAIKLHHSFVEGFVGFEQVWGHGERIV